MVCSHSPRASLKYQIEGASLDNGADEGIATSMQLPLLSVKSLPSNASFRPVKTAPKVCRGTLAPLTVRPTRGGMAVMLSLEVVFTTAASKSASPSKATPSLTSAPIGTLKIVDDAESSKLTLSELPGSASNLPVTLSGSSSTCTCRSPSPPSGLLVGAKPGWRAMRLSIRPSVAETLCSNMPRLLDRVVATCFPETMRSTSACLILCALLRTVPCTVNLPVRTRCRRLQNSLLSALSLSLRARISCRSTPSCRGRGSLKAWVGILLKRLICRGDVGRKLGRCFSSCEAGLLRHSLRLLRISNPSLWSSASAPSNISSVTISSSPSSEDEPSSNPLSNSSMSSATSSLVSTKPCLKVECPPPPVPPPPSRAWRCWRTAAAALPAAMARVSLAADAVAVAASAVLVGAPSGAAPALSRAALAVEISAA
mmetsp:Transcript_18534/g.34492  ORF Transcript_18534/g.34492 Transcript_18534/m.34492 type:complete len:427 (-) Transcript_18534:721-2001(-)